jgi:hypothetical protein
MVSVEWVLQDQWCGEGGGRGQSPCSRTTSVRGASGPSFYLCHTCLVINVPVTVESFGRHTANPAMTPPCAAFRKARCFTLGESLEFVRGTVKALNQLFNAILSFGTHKKSHGSKSGMEGRCRTFILFLATNWRTKYSKQLRCHCGETSTPNFYSHAVWDQYLSRRQCKVSP